MGRRARWMCRLWSEAAWKRRVGHAIGSRPRSQGGVAAEEDRSGLVQYCGENPVHTNCAAADEFCIMPFIEWTPAYDLGIEELDRQHRRLVEIVNRLHDAMEQGCPRGAMQGAVYDLVSYTEIHFATEERLMRRLEYPGLESHRDKHQVLTRELDEYASALASERMGVSMEFMSFLREWLLNHVVHADGALANHAFGSRQVGSLVLCSQRF